MNSGTLPGDAVEHGYRHRLHDLQVELVKFQRHLIKRLVEHLSPRDTRVVALPAPSDRQRTEWYFQRYVVHLPAAGEFLLFNRSWYNRAGVERIMGFCTGAEAEAFL